MLTRWRMKVSGNFIAICKGEKSTTLLVLGIEHAKASVKWKIFPVKMFPFRNRGIYTRILIYTRYIIYWHIFYLKSIVQIFFLNQHGLGCWFGCFLSPYILIKPWVSYEYDMNRIQWISTIFHGRFMALSWHFPLKTPKLLKSTISYSSQVHVAFMPLSWRFHGTSNQTELQTLSCYFHGRFMAFSWHFSKTTISKLS